MDYLKETFFYQNSLFQYLISFIIFAASFLVMSLALYILTKILFKVNKKLENDFLHNLTKSVRKRARPLIFTASLAIARLELILPKSLGLYWEKIIIILAIVFSIFLICDVIGNFIDDYLSKKDGVVISDGIISIIKVIVWIMGFLTILANLGVNISAFITGLGIGGVAVAFAAQSIVSDLFNYLVILFDKPFLKGDFIQIDQDLGTVEYIGVKSTRIRRNSGEQLLISNTNLLASRIQNYRVLEKRRKYTVIRAEYSTPLEKLKIIPEIIKKVIEDTPNTEFYLARFTEFAESSLNFEIIYYVLTPDYTEFMATVESVNYNIVEELGKIGVNFALPSRTLYTKNIDKA